MVAERSSLSKVIVSSAEARLFFNEEVLSALLPGKVAGQAKRRHITRRGALTLLSYKLRVKGESPDQPRQVTITFGLPKMVKQLYERHYGGRPLLPDGGSGAGALYLHEHGCLVELFPANWRLPSLADALDPERAAVRLSDVLEERIEPSGLGVEIIRYRSHRSCVIRYGTGGRKVVGKVYPPGGLAREVYGKMLALSDPSAPLRAPAVLGLLDEWDLLLMDEARGWSLKGALRPPVDDGQALHGVQVAARGLAHLRGMRLETERHRTFEQQFETLSRRAGRLQDEGSDEPALRSLLVRIQSLAERLPPARPALIHGDFKPSQVFVDGDQAVVVDLDRLCAGDPAIDLGSFAGVLRKKGLLEGRHGHGALADAFMAEYASLAQQDGLIERARLFQSMVLTRMAVSKFETPHRRTERPFDLLEEAELCLRGL